MRDIAVKRVEIDLYQPKRQDRLERELCVMRRRDAQQCEMIRCLIRLSGTLGIVLLCMIAFMLYVR